MNVSAGKHMMQQHTCSSHSLYNVYDMSMLSLMHIVWYRHSGSAQTTHACASLMMSGCREREGKYHALMA